MKKFEPDYQIIRGDYGNSSTQAVMREKANGRYVLAEEAEALEQLNKEMLEVLKEAAAMLLPDDESLGMYEYNFQQFAKKLKSIIAKAEEA